MTLFNRVFDERSLPLPLVLLSLEDLLAVGADAELLYRGVLLSALRTVCLAAIVAAAQLALGKLPPADKASRHLFLTLVFSTEG